MKLIDTSRRRSKISEKKTTLPGAVKDAKTGTVLGSTRYHDIIPDADRVEIGYTWYASRTPAISIPPASCS